MISEELTGGLGVRRKIGICLLACMTFLGGCTTQTASIETDGMKKVDSFNLENNASYSDQGEVEEVLETYASEDGLCKIRKHATYYEVDLDYEKGTPAKVGTAYGRMILESIPEYETTFEPYLFENIRLGFDGRQIHYDTLEKRIRTLFDSLPAEYKEEVDAFAKAISEGEEGFEENGQLSYIEAVTMQMIPDALRPTACSALSLWGSKTKSGERITMRNLEWNIGSAGQMTKIHAVVHLKKGDRSITAISMLGVLDIITAVNDDGVMVGILDVGSVQNVPYVYEGKKCYTFALRYALEEFTTAREFGEYMNHESGDFTWCHNLILSDKKESFCVEDATKEVADTGLAKSMLRSADTPIHEGLTWNSKDSLCIVNSFTGKGNQDGFSISRSNLVRFMKYDQWVSEKDKFSVADVKGIMAKEVVDQSEVSNVHNNATVHTVILDYDTGRIQVAFTKGDCAEDVPVYLEIGHY